MSLSLLAFVQKFASSCEKKELYVVHEFDNGADTLIKQKHLIISKSNTK